MWATHNVVLSGCNHVSSRSIVYLHGTGTDESVNKALGSAHELFADAQEVPIEVSSRSIRVRGFISGQTFFVLAPFPTETEGTISLLPLPTTTTSTAVDEKQPAIATPPQPKKIPLKNRINMACQAENLGQMMEHLEDPELEPGHWMQILGWAVSHGQLNLPMFQALKAAYERIESNRFDEDQHAEAKQYLETRFGAALEENHPAFLRTLFDWMSHQKFIWNEKETERAAERVFEHLLQLNTQEAETELKQVAYWMIREQETLFLLNLLQKMGDRCIPLQTLEILLLDPFHGAKLLFSSKKMFIKMLSIPELMDQACQLLFKLAGMHEKNAANLAGLDAWLSIALKGKSDKIKLFAKDIAKHTALAKTNQMLAQLSPAPAETAAVPVKVDVETQLRDAFASWNRGALSSYGLIGVWTTFLPRLLDSNNCEAQIQEIHEDQKQGKDIEPMLRQAVYLWREEKLIQAYRKKFEKTSDPQALVNASARIVKVLQREPGDSLFEIHPDDLLEEAYLCFQHLQKIGFSKKHGMGIYLLYALFLLTPQGNKWVQRAQALRKDFCLSDHLKPQKLKALPLQENLKKELVEAGRTFTKMYPKLKRETVLSLNPLSGVIAVARLKITQNPSSHNDWKLWGDAYLTGKHYHRALECYLEALRLQPSKKAQNELHAALGEIYYHLKDAKKVIYHLEKLPSVEGHQCTLLATVYLKSAMPEKAKPLAQKYLLIEDCNLIKGSVLLAMAHAQLCEFSEAKRCLEKALKRYPNDEQLIQQLKAVEEAEAKLLLLPL